MPEQPSASIVDSCSIHDFDELLSLDDVFVQYFNEFLRLGIFVQKIDYHRQLNTFLLKTSNQISEIKDESFLEINQKNSINNDDNNSIYSGFSDLIQLDDIPDDPSQNSPNAQKTRQAQMMEWAKNERLALFWRTELYRQYKLCKLLLRPLSNEKEASEYSSQGIGGYSRQSIYTAARTLSTDNSNGNPLVPTGTLEEEDEDQQELDQNDNFLNANTIFENSILAAEYLRAPRPFLRPGSRAYSVPAKLASSLSIVLPNLQLKYPTKYSKRSSSSKTSQRKSIPKDEENNSMNDPSLSMMSSAKIRYFEDGENDENNDDFANLGLEIQSSSNQLKYKYLGSYRGMQAFIRFLQTTNGGYDLYRFWMDCEFFKDTMAGLDQIENVAARTRLFRDLNDGKYHLPFMRHLQNKIRRAYAETAGVLTHEVFLQVQYDVLRRLRMYWSARFIIHQLYQKHHTQIHFPIESKRPSTVCLYPIDERVDAGLVEMTRVFLSDDYTTVEENQEVPDEIEKAFESVFMKKFSTIIRQDKNGGGLFLRYITFNERRLLPLILFCYDVDDFRYSNLDDKILESQHGLSILNTYFGNSAKLSLDHFMPDIQIHNWIDAFHQYKFDKLSFEPLFKRALLMLKDAWLRCLQEDIDRFTAAYYLISSPPQSVNGSEDEEEKDEEAEEGDNDDDDLRQQKKPSELVRISAKNVPRTSPDNTQMKISNDMIYIKRPWLKRFIPSAPSERRERLIEAFGNAMTDEDRKRLRAERRDRLRRIEENRKRALRAAIERQRTQANNKDGSDNKSSSVKTGQSRRQKVGFYIDRILPNQPTTIQKNCQRLILSHFQRHIRTSKTAKAKLENKLSFVFEIVKWLDNTNPLEKQQHSDRMKRTYLDNQSKRNVLPLTRDQNQMLNANSGRLNETSLHKFFQDYRVELEDEFTRYCEERVKEFELTSIDDFLSKSIDNLTVLFNETGEVREGGGDDDDMGLLFDPDVEALAANDDGTGKVTKKHFGELFQLLADAAIGRFNERFYYFYAYLTHWVDEKKAPYLDLDLLYCIDVSRLKEIAQENMLQAKLRYILETYFEATVTSNSVNCRLDLTNTDLQMRILRALQKSLTGNANDFGPLDEARTILLKDKLVFYYAGFKAYLFRMNLSKTHPSRLARLQEQLILYRQQQQLQAKKSAKTATTRSSVSTKGSLRKVRAASSPQRQITVTPSIDITTTTKTQHLLNERIKAFEQLPTNQVPEIHFPTTTTTTNNNKATVQRPSIHPKSRVSNIQDGHFDRLNSDKDKARGPISIQYTLTGGLKVKVSDGKQNADANPNGANANLPTHQVRDGTARSIGSTSD